MIMSEAKETYLPHGGKRAEGGPRKNSGRKPKPFVELRNRLIQNKVEEAEASFAFLVTVRDTPTERTEVRLEAAKQILDRVLGKAVEMRPQDKDDELYKSYAAKIKALIDGHDQTTQAKDGHDQVKPAETN